MATYRVFKHQPSAVRVPFHGPDLARVTKPSSLACPCSPGGEPALSPALRWPRPAGAAQLGARGCRGAEPRTLLSVGCCRGSPNRYGRPRSVTESPAKPGAWLRPRPSRLRAPLPPRLPQPRAAGARCGRGRGGGCGRGRGPGGGSGWARPPSRPRCLVAGGSRRAAAQCGQAGGAHGGAAAPAGSEHCTPCRGGPGCAPPGAAAAAALPPAWPHREGRESAAPWRGAPGAACPACCGR